MSWKDNTGWQEGHGSLRFREAIADPMKIREGVARGILGDRLFEAYVDIMPVEWHHNEIGQIEYFLTEDDLKRARNNSAFYLRLYAQNHRKTEGKAFVVTADEYDSDVHKVLAWGYLTKSGRFVKSSNMFRQTHAKVKKYK